MTDDRPDALTRREFLTRAGCHAHPAAGHRSTVPPRGRYRHAGAARRPPHPGRDRLPAMLRDPKRWKGTSHEETRRR